MAGVEATIEVQGDYRESTVVFPGQRIRIFESGELLFVGRVAEARGSSASSKSEVQSFNCRDPRWAARQVVLEADDKVGAHYFNVYVAEADQTSDACVDTAPTNAPDEWDPDLQNMTIGEIIKWLFDRYLDELRKYGAAPPSSVPYVQAELDLLTAIQADISLHGTFLSAIDALLKYVPNVQMIVDGSTTLWHFSNVTSLTAETIAMPVDFATNLKINPDPDKCYTAVIWRGTKKQDADDVELSLAAGSLVPAWLSDQESAHSDAKTNLTGLTTKIASSGTLTNVTINNKFWASLDYIDISAADATLNGVDTNDWRGATTTVNGFTRFIVGNTSTRFYLSAPNWASPPTVGDTFAVSLLNECAQQGLSAMGVGAGFILRRPGDVCGTNILPGAWAQQKLKNKGFCGTARVTAQGYGGVGASFAQEYEYRVRLLNEQAQNAFGFCDPVIHLAKPALIPLGLVNYLGKLPPGKGSAPPTPCAGGAAAIPPGVDLQVVLSSTESVAAYQRWPATGYSGPAFDDWHCENTLVVDDPNFKSLAIQGPGILIAQQAIVSMFSQKAYTVEVTVAGAWGSDDPSPTTTTLRPSRFAWLRKKLRLSSTERTTGFESNDDLPVYEVVWKIRERQVVIKAGTPIAWSSFDPRSLASSLIDSNLLKRVYNKMKEIEDFRNGLIGHSASRVGGGTPSYSGCQVSYSNNDTRKFSDVNTTVNLKDRKIGSLAAGQDLGAMLTFARKADNPGSPISLPGLSAAASQMPIRSAAVLESAAKPHMMGEQGPAGILNSDRSRYDGLTGMDDATAGGPADELGRFGGYAFRRKPDADGNVHGGGGLQAAPLDTDGAPGTYFDLDGPESFPNDHVPLSIIAVGTLLDTLLRRIVGVEDAAGVSTSPTSELTVAPGSADAAFADGAPPNLIQTAIAMAAFAGSQLLGPSLNDPGGPVFTGPKNDHGLDSETYWRVAVPELVAYQVEAVSAGTGTNGGNWSAVLVDGAPTYASGASIFHKQAHAAELDSDRSADCDVCSTTPTVDDSPFTFANARGRTLPDTGISGAGTIFPLPRGATGKPMLEALLAEVPSDPTGNGDTHVVHFQYSYKSSTWSASTGTTPGTGLTGDASGEAVGRFYSPGGSVPTGLRPPSDKPTLLALSLRKVPASGTSAGPVSLAGIGVTIAVIDGGIWIRISEGVGAADDTRHNHPQSIETANVAEAWALETTKNRTESASCSDSVSCELNPPVALDESPTVADSTVLDVTKNATEAATVHDVTTLTLNP